MKRKLKAQAGSKYGPLPGSRFTAEQADRYGRHLDTLREKHKGKLTNELIITDAQRSQSPLHDYFTLDKEKAVKMLWNNECDYLLRNIGPIEVIQGEPIVIPIRNWFHSNDEDKDKGETIIKTLAEVARSPVERNAIILLEEARLAECSQRLENILHYFRASKAKEHVKQAVTHTKKAQLALQRVNASA